MKPSRDSTNPVRTSPVRSPNRAGAAGTAAGGRSGQLRPTAGSWLACAALVAFLGPLGPLCLCAQLQVLTNAGPVRVFGGELAGLNLRLRNPTTGTIQADLRFQLVLTSSATAAPLGVPAPGGRVVLPPGQTVEESVNIRFPVVRGVTRFVVRWGVADGPWLGTSDVLVFPNDLLLELPRIARGAVGVIDPDNQLKPMLRAHQIEWADLDWNSLEDYDGRLVLLGPFGSTEQAPSDLEATVLRGARRGMAIVWMLPPAKPDEQRSEEPRDYLLQAGRGAVFVSGSEAVAGMSKNPAAQLNLIRFARLALQVDRLELPKLKLKL